MSKEINQAVNDFLSAASIIYSVSYMGETPKAWSGDRKPSQMDQWQVKFRKNRKEISEFYFTGLGHRNQFKKPVKPSAASVLYSLLMDATAMHESFNDWCDNYGYSNDSISAFRTYQDCCETGKKFCQIFTKEESDKLREMLQDY